MTSLNDNLKKLDSRNTFLRVKEKTNIYKQNNPNTAILNLGIGDVSLPIIKPITDAMKNAVGDLSNIKTFKGYGNYFGYDFLKLKIIDNEYKNLHITSDEIYVSNGTKSDTSNVLELFDKDSKILVFNPSYPVHRDGAILSGYNVSYLDLEEENNFMPRIPNEIYDIIYICSPSNPIGIAFDKKTLTKWIDYARKNNSVILYDNVYNAFIRGENIPKSIYELDYAKEVAIEFRSFSKTISFTGVRCSYYVIPNILKIKGTKENVNELWKERTMNKYNGTDYIAQVGATASYSDESKKIIKNNIEYYLENAKILRSSLENLGFVVYGGTDSPYLWIRTMNNMDSWQYYDFLLKEFNIIAIPGVVFGLNALEITDINIFFEGWWTLFIIVPCFIDLFKDKDKTGSIIGLIIGVCLLLGARDLLDFNVIWKLLVPFVLVVIGLSIIFKDVIGNKVRKEIKKINRNTDKEYCATFGAQDIDFDKEEFDGCKLSAVFGGVKCDLRDSIIKKDTVIDASAIFGAVTIYVPKDVNVKVASTPIFGGVSDERKNRTKDAKVTLYINATCMFGGVEIK